jgi:O-antigen/teichoic acid export membrane protein
MPSDSEPILEIDADVEPMPLPELDVVLEPPSVTAPAAVEMKRRSVLFLVSSLVGGNVVSMILRMVGGVLQARCVLPAVLGLYNSIGLVLGYAPFLQLGILNGINRELPYYIGKGDRPRVNELAAAAQAWALAVGGSIGVALSGVGGWQLAHGQWQLAAGWFTNAVLALVLFYNNYYLQMTYRTGHDFTRLAMSSVIENIVSLALVSLVALLSFYGLCLRALLGAAVGVSFLYYWRPLRVGPHWNWSHLQHLLVIGAPIFFVGQLYAWWPVLNSTLVFAYMGQQGLGLYSIVLLAGGALELLPAAFGQVLYPRMTEYYGRTGRLDGVIRMSIGPNTICVVGIIPLIVVGWFAVGPVVRFIVPAYVDAVPAIRWSLLVPFCSALAGINNLFPVARQMGLYAVALLCGMAGYGLALTWLTRNGISLIVFPQAMLVGRIVFVLASYVLIGYLVYREGRSE